jgi:hypothetical protein
MSRFEFHIGEELLELIATNIGERGLKAFVKDFAEWADFVLEDDDEEYIEVEDSLSESESESEEEEVFGVEVEEEYETEVDENGFHSIKECKVKNQN